MNRNERSLALGLLCLLVWAIGTPVPTPAEAGEVRLYTNADLERFSTLPDSRVQADAPSAEEWRFVTDYLQRQYTRIDADRAYSMDRERSEAEAESIRRESNRRTYGLPVYWNRYDAWHRVPGSSKGGGTAGRIKRSPAPSGSIRPLHAGPTRAQIDHFKASRRSGADAVPGNSRARSGGGRRR